MTLEPIVKRFLADLIRWALQPPTQPGELTFTVVGESAVAKANVTRVTLPALPEGNPEGVAIRTLRVDEASVETPIYNEGLAVDAPPVILTLKQNVTYTFTLYDSDAAGNKSPERVQAYTPTDVTPPSQPGEFGFEVTAEVNV